MCMTLNSAAECAGSMFHVVVTGGDVAVGIVHLLPSFGWMQDRDIRCNKYLVRRPGKSVTALPCLAIKGNAWTFNLLQ